MTGTVLEVLLIEANPESATAIKELLRESDRFEFKVSYASTVAGALEQLAHHNISLMLLDLDLPNGQGLQGFENIHQAFPEIPKIVLANVSDEDSALKAIAAGAKEYVLKPRINAEKLIRAIAYAIDGSRFNEPQKPVPVASSHAFWQACRKMIDFCDNPSIMLDEDGSVFYLNPAAAGALGKQPEEQLDAQFDLTENHPSETRISRLRELADRRDDILWTALFGGDQVRYVFSWGPSKQGESAPVAVENDSGHDLAFLMLNHMAEAVIGTDKADRIIYMNGVAEQFTEFTLDEAIGEPLDNIFQMMVREDHSNCQMILDHTRSASAPLLLPRDTLIVGKRETTRFIAGSATAIVDGDGEFAGTVLVFRDVSDRRQIGENLRKADKLESVGLLAGGIAHDYNNLLTGILGNISLVKLLVNADPRARKHLGQAEKALLRSRELTQQLLTFSKGGSPVKEVATIQEIVEESAGFALSGAKVSMEFSAADDLKAVEVDRGQIGQVIHNLVINAVQAMPDGGGLELTLSNFIAFGETVTNLAPGEYIRIMVKDNGKGISAENIEKIFDPYFTTKKSGNGLGLAICYSIIRKHDGIMTVSSQVGEGTQFDIYLPVSDKTVEIHVKEGGEIISGHQKILVIDDELILVETAHDLLEFLGYEVQTALNSNDAFELFEKATAESKPFDVVLLDLTLPGDLGGEEILKGLKDIDPSVKAIVSSGYSTSTIMSEYANYGFAGMVSKPYSVEELSEELQRVISHAEQK